MTGNFSYCDHCGGNHDNDDCPDTLLQVLRDLYDEYRDRKCQFGDSSLWVKHEHKPSIEAAEKALGITSPSEQP